MRDFDNLSRRVVGIWEVLEFDHMEYHGANKTHGMSYYKCECKKCGRTFIKPRSNILQNNTRHIGECRR